MTDDLLDLLAEEFLNLVKAHARGDAGSVAELACDLAYTATSMAEEASRATRQEPVAA